MTNKIVLDKLSSVTSGIDLVQVPPLHQKRLLAFVNHFIITTVTFLNNFAQTCEQKLFYCDQKMQKLEAELCILEAKLNSIPGLDVEVKQPPAGSGFLADEVDKSMDQESSLLPPIAPPNVDESAGEIQSTETDSTTPSAAKDPELAQYFKMVQIGVPIPAVKLKMQREGFDPNVLDS